MAKKQESEVATPVYESTTPTMYTVDLGVKYPSAHTQYKMIEAHFSVTSPDYDEAQQNAIIGLDQAVINLCESYNEPIPKEITDRLEAE